MSVRFVFRCISLKMHAHCTVRRTHYNTFDTLFDIYIHHKMLIHLIESKWYFTHTHTQTSFRSRALYMNIEYDIRLLDSVHHICVCIRYPLNNLCPLSFFLATVLSLSNEIAISVINPLYLQWKRFFTWVKLITMATVNYNLPFKQNMKSCDHFS